MVTKRRITDDYSDEEWEFIHLLNDCYNYSEDVLDTLKPRRTEHGEYSNKDKLQITATCQFIKIITTTKAVLLLMENHMLVEVSILLRYQLEALFILKACHEEEEFIGNYLMTFYGNKIKHENIICNNLKDVDVSTKANVDKKIAELKKEFNDDDIKEMDIQEIAGKAKLSGLYNKPYTMLCEVAHVGPGTLKEHFILDDNENIKRIIVELYHVGVTKMTFLLSVDILLKSIDTVNKLFVLNLDEECGKLNERYEECIKNYSA